VRGLAVGLASLSLALWVSIAQASAAAQKIDPAKAPSLSKEEASTLIGANVFKNRRFTVLKVNPSPVAGLWEVILETDQGRTILYIDSSRKYFLGGPILSLQGMKNKTEESLRAFGDRKVDVSQIPLDDALVLGNPKAAMRVVVFLSPTCKPCKEMLQALKQVAGRRKDVAFFLKMLPDGPTGEGFWMSETIVSQRSLELLEQSLAGAPIPRPNGPEPRVSRTMDLADRLSILSTPTILLADGTVVEGALPPDALLGWIDRHSKGPGDRQDKAKK